jgi:uncharacterized protein (DUF433 family)
MSQIITAIFDGETLHPETTFFIQKTKGVCGGNARIRETRIAVWTIIIKKEKQRKFLS